MLISELRVNEIVKQFVPEKYLPKPEGPVRDILYVSREALDEFVAQLGVPRLVGAQALCIDRNELKGIDKLDDFIIVLSNDILLEEHLIFVLLHEIGHVDFHFCEDEKKKFGGDTEVYADIFAHCTLNHLVGFSRSFEMLTRYCSADGFGKEVLKENAK